MRTTGGFLASRSICWRSAWPLAEAGSWGFGLSPQGRPPLNLQGALPGGGLLGTLMDDPAPGGGPKVWVRECPREAHLIWSTSWGSGSGESPPSPVCGCGIVEPGSWVSQGPASTLKASGCVKGQAGLTGQKAFWPPLSADWPEATRSPALQRPSAWELEQKQGGLGPPSDQSLHLSCSWNLLWKTRKQWQILVWKFILFWPLPNIGKIILFLQVHQSRKGSPLSLGPV